jgi:rfaE bifunctional protein nucleotidyltransferase chain/domain
MNTVYLKVSEHERTIIENNRALSERKNIWINYADQICKKPWGHEFLVYESKQIGIWCLTVMTGHATSLHTHFHKDTFVIVLDGCAKLETPEGVQSLSTLQSVHIPAYKFHALGAFSPTVTLLEIEIFKDQTRFSDKNDLLRLNDTYHRASTGYESSVTILKSTEEWAAYGGFQINSDNKNIIGNTILETKSYCEAKAHYNILLEGQIFHEGIYMNPGSVLPDKLCVNGQSVTILTITNPCYTEDAKIIYSQQHLATMLKQIRDPIILTSGCYDIVHVGHLNTLRQAKQLGGNLMVCLSSDEQITKLKGDGRPINKYQDRIDLFKTIAYVDYIVLYNEENIEREETLGAIMKLVNPSCWVKGGDYTKEQILAKHPYLRSIVIFSLVEGKSTTNIVKQIQNSET